MYRKSSLSDVIELRYVWPPPLYCGGFRGSSVQEERSGKVLLVLEQLAEELANFRFGGGEHPAARRRRAIEPANAAAVSMVGGLEVALGFEAVQDGIQRARTDLIAMPGQLFDHAEAEDVSLSGVMEDVKPNQSGIQVSVVRRHGQVADRLCAAGWICCKNPVKRTPLHGQRRRFGGRYRAAQGQRERTASAGFADNGQGPSHRFGQLLRERKAESGAVNLGALHRRAPIERFENVRQITGGNPNSLIRDTDLHLSLIGRRIDHSR